MNELVNGIFLPQTREELLAIVERLKERAGFRESFWRERNCP
jgi:hypothetical protein